MQIIIGAVQQQRDLLKLSLDCLKYRGPIRIAIMLPLQRMAVAEMTHKFRRCGQDEL
jgi:hypothetical protein